MTSQELSNHFDVLYNNITSNQAPSLNEYEKSILLTDAQMEIVKSYFNPKLNKVQEGFDGNERRQIDFSMILKDVTLNGNFSASNVFTKSNAVSITIPSDVMSFINEFVVVDRTSPKRDNLTLVTIPIDYRSFSTMSSKPYMRPPQYQAWRLISNTSKNKVEILPGANDTIKSYKFRYIKRPYPIILEELDDDITIDGKNTPYPTYVLKYTKYNLNSFLDAMHNEGIYSMFDIEYSTASNNIKSKLPEVLNYLFGYKGSDTEKALDAIKRYVSNLREDCEDAYILSEGEIYIYLVEGEWMQSTNITMDEYKNYIKVGAGIGNTSTNTVNKTSAINALRAFFCPHAIEYKQGCELDPSIHEEIVQRAVEKAKAIWEGSLNSTLSLGINSSTPIGMASSGNNKRGE